jgi:hypothetical protein
MAGVGAGYGLARTRDAEGTFAAYTAVIKGTGANQAKAPGAANVAALGIAQDKGDDGVVSGDLKFRQVAVVSQGPAKATAGGNVAIGQPLKIEGVTGKLIAVGGEGADLTVNVVAIAQSPGADTDIIDVDVQPYIFTTESA